MLRRTTKSTIGTLLLGACLAGAWSPALHAGDDPMKLYASDGSAGDRFGLWMDVSGDVLVVGADLDDDNGADSGSAYVFRWNGDAWVEEAKLMPSHASAGDECAARIAVDGNVAILGSVHHDANGDRAGAAWVFRWNGASWVEEVRLLASDGIAGDRFGHSVAAFGDRVLVGASQETSGGPGAAYVFHWNGASWIEEAKLTAPDGADQDEFGMAVALGDGVAVVGSWRDDDNGYGSGSVYVFRRTGSDWIQEAKLMPADGGSEDYFGNNIAMDGDSIIVGASWDYPDGVKSGSAYVFRWNGVDWNEEAKLVPSDGDAGDEFGFRGLDIEGDVAIIGSYRDGDRGWLSGSAYLFRRTSSAWFEQAKLLAFDGVQDDRFGISAALRGGTAFVGASAYQTTTRPGAVYVYDIGTTLCPADLDGNGVVGFEDLTAMLSKWGPCAACPADMNGSGDDWVGLDDLVMLLAAWGPC